MEITLFASTYKDNGLLCTVKIVWDQGAENYTVSNCSHETEWCRHYGIFSNLDDALTCYTDNLENIHSEN
jgi:hypothetical protein